MIPNINLTLPKELHEKLEYEAKQSHISIDQYILF